MRSVWKLNSIFLALVFGLSVVNISCNNDDDNEQPASPADEYYVKYELRSQTIYSGAKMDVTIRREDNSLSTIIVGQGGLWEITVGPVARGFNSSLDAKATGNTYDKLKLNANIYCSKNGSPFAIKAIDGSDTPRDNVKIEYTIDY